LSFDDTVAFKEKAKALDIQPVFVHGSYLINLISISLATILQSKHSLMTDLKFSSAIGATGVIFHFGSNPDGWAKTKKNCIPLISDILAKTPEDSLFIIENSAGAGFKVGASVEELKLMQEDIGSPRVRFCIDTAHAFAAGYDLRTKETVDQFVDHLDSVLGWDQVVAIHFNDSKVDWNKKNDRHENIGHGYIGSEGLHAFGSHTKVKKIPYILEIPGFNHDGPDRKNVELVKSFSW